MIFIHLRNFSKYIDKTGKLLSYNDLKSHDEIVIFSQDEKMGLKHLNGKIVVPCKYDIVQNFSEGMAAVCEETLWGYVDSLGNNIIPCLYRSVNYYDNGVMDDWGEYGSPDEANDFHEGLAIVKKNGALGYVDKEGKSTFDVAANNTSKPRAVEVMPSFPGGQQGLMEWFNSNFQVPAEAVRDRAVGKTVVSFVVSKTGEVTNVEILESVHPAIDEVAKKLFVKMPRWTPGTLDGVPVNVKYSMPFNVNTIQ